MVMTRRDTLIIRVLASDAIVRDGMVAQLRAYPSVSVAEDPGDVENVTIFVWVRAFTLWTLYVNDRFEGGHGHAHV